MVMYDGRGFHMIGNVYYVGGSDVSVHLLTSKAGHILIDTGNPGYGPGILKRVSDLGFDPGDIKYIVMTHAHLDHVASAKYLGEETGAKLCIGEADVAYCEQGAGTTRSGIDVEPFTVDVRLREGDVIAVGDTQVHVYHTPGHTPGCSSFEFQVTDQGHTYRAFMFGGRGTNVFSMPCQGMGIYGGTVQQFADTLSRMATFEPDVWLGSHPNHNATFEKRDRLAKGAQPNPYIDRAGYKREIAAVQEQLDRFIRLAAYLDQGGVFTP